MPILEAALESSRQEGCLGSNIMGSGFDFDIKLRSGAGAYVCGEETALFESIEGKRGEPRFRPPFPGTKLFTVCGNVKRRGVFEFPMGINLKDLIYEVCGGMEEGRKLLAVQTGEAGTEKG